MDWFERITGFRELDYHTTRGRLSVVDGRLHSTHCARTWGVGHLETPTLAELRQRAQGQLAGHGAIRVTCLRGDVRRLHGEPRFAGAMFQVASQFNLLEMVGPSVSPEDGVTRHATDATQGPACAIAAGAGTIYRNYLVPTAHGVGQQRDRQIDCLQDVGVALGNADGSLWRMRNGYCLLSDQSLATVDERLAALDGAARHALMGRLRIGVHTDVEVTDGDAGHFVDQAYCSALPVAYHRIRRPEHWTRFARLVLDGAYEATLLAAVLRRTAAAPRPSVLLTRLGGGAFGNDAAWITDALRRALLLCRDAGLDVFLVSHGAPGVEDERLAAEFAAARP